ncbi:MAG: CPBP family glutamic-type intramembrane protease [Alphaproteobacteria bacterium]
MALRLYWVLAFALAWAITIPLALDVHRVTDFGIPQAAGVLIGFAPAIAAVIAAIVEGRVGELWSRVIKLRAPIWAYMTALSLPVLFLAAPFVVAGVTGSAPPRLYFDPTVAIFAGAWFVLALGEEIGWRGYALPKLMERRSFLTAASILGVLWTIWHFPKLFASPYLPGFAEALPQIGLFSVQIFLANVIICWLFQRSGAVLEAAIYHTAFNTVATVHPMAALDLSVTAATGLAALLIVVFDPRAGRVTPPKKAARAMG